MYKLVVLSCLFAAAFAKPGYLSEHHHGLETISVHSDVPVVKTAIVHEPSLKAVHEHTLTQIGEKVEHIPTSVSHHSSSVVHSKADIVTPVLAPKIRTHYIPTVNTYAKQYIENVPVVQSYVEPTVVKSYAAPAYVDTYASHYSPSYASHYSPLTYASSYHSHSHLPYHARHW